MLCVRHWGIRIPQLFGFLDCNLRFAPSAFDVEIRRFLRFVLCQPDPHPALRGYVSDPMPAARAGHPHQLPSADCMRSDFPSGSICHPLSPFVGMLPFASLEPSTAPRSHQGQAIFFSSFFCCTTSLLLSNHNKFVKTSQKKITDHFPCFAFSPKLARSSPTGALLCSSGQAFEVVVSIHSKG